MTAAINPDLEHLKNELEVFETMIPGFVGSILRAGKALDDQHWNWSFSERTPTPRETCEHTLMWLWCDRQQLTVPDWNLHKPTPAMPSGRRDLIKLMETEAAEWRRLIRSLTLTELDQTMTSWDGKSRTVRSHLFHIGQHVVYKAGQMWILAFELGVDGAGPYSAPTPDELYGFETLVPWPTPRRPRT